jgi:glycosyltransferase involved in cell wall biosynthesis
MRVAYVCADPGVPVFGRKGCSIHVQEVSRALKAHGAVVDLFAARVDGPPPPGLEDVALHALPLGAAHDPAARERAAMRANRAFHHALARGGNFDAVYERYSLWSFAGMRFARAAGIPGVLEVNAPLIEEQAEHRTLCDEAAATRIAARTFAAAHTIVAVSQGVADYVTRYPGTDGRVNVIANGVDPSRFPSPASCLSQRPGGVFTVGFVGTLKPWHGLPILVDAFADLHAEDSRVRLIVVGDGPWRARFEENLAARGLSSVTRLIGAVPPTDIPSLLTSMDAAVAPYAARPDFYFSPLKVLEYMAAGLPVVASRIGQIPELIADGKTGLLCEPDNPRSLADRLRLLRDTPVLRLKLGAAARAAVMMDHTWMEVTRRIFMRAGLTLPVRDMDARTVNEFRGAQS